MAWHQGDRPDQRPRNRVLVPAILIGLIASFVLLGARPVRAAPPSNDDFVAATSLVGDLGSLSGTNVDASVEAGEPAHGGFGPERSVWFEWTPSVTGNGLLDVDISQCCTDDLILAVYTGSAVDALTPVVADGPDFALLGVEFPVVAGTTYRIAVAGQLDSDASSFDLDWDVGPVNDMFAAAATLVGDTGTLTSTNVDASTETGEPAHGGFGPERSVWFDWTPSVTGNGILDVEVSACCTDDLILAVYTGSAVDALTPVVADGPDFALLGVEFPVVAGTTYRIAVAGQLDSDASSFDLDWEAQALPPNDDFANATPMAGDAGWLLDQTNDFATAESVEPDHVRRTPKASVWYDWTPSETGDAVVRATMQSTFDEIVVAVYTGAAIDGLAEVASGGGFGWHDVRLEFEVIGGTTYHLVVDGYEASDTGPFDLTWALSPPPNDDLADRIVLDERNGTAVGATEGATPEIGEPTHGGVPGTPAHSVWYEWTPIWDGDAEIDLDTPAAPDDWASVVAVYTGSQLGSLIPVVSAGTAGTHLDLDFPVVGGTNYTIVVDGQTTDDSGTFDLTWSYAPYGGTWTVTKTADTADGVCDSDCSLREAVVAANATGGDDTITLPAGQYDLTIGSLGVGRETGTTSIIGAVAETTVIDATRLGDLSQSFRSRVISVEYHAGLELVGVTITGGYTVTGADKDGAGVVNFNGTLAITDCIIEDNWSGENGGGISNQLGTATITNSIIRNNSTNPPEYATYSAGGGIYNSGVMTIVDSTIVSNESSGGGGVASDAGELHIQTSLIAGNTAGRGGGIFNGGGIATIDRVTIADNDASGYSSGGGGVFNWADMTIIDSVIDGNEASATSFYIERGSGGGVENQYPGNITITGTTITNNAAIGEQWDTSPLLGGRGGGVANIGGTASIENSTISGNTAAIVDRWDPYTYPYLDGGGGGGVAHQPYVYVGPSTNILYCPVTVLDGVTITANTAAHGGGVNSRWEDDWLGLYGYANWPDLSVDYPYGFECPDFYVTNSIIAGNEATVSAGNEDSWGGYTSLGHNLVGDGTGAPSDGPGDIVTIDPMLSPLADFGGPTETYALLPGSPAIDAGETDLAVDQRGVSRPQGVADDIGAFEVDAGPNTAPVLAPIGNLVVTEGDILDVPIFATDSDGDALIFWMAGAPGFASLTDHGDGTATLSLAPGYADHGSYPGVVVTVSDAAAIDGETIAIDVADANGAPAADDQSVFAWQDTSVEIVLTGSDPDPDGITFSIDTPPAHGRLTGTPPVVTYTPDERYLGDDSFTFITDDGQVPSPVGTVSIAVHDIRPDPRFGTDGQWVSGFGVLGGAEAAVELPDGSVLVAGWNRPGGNESVLLKLTPDGELDPSFGTGGVVVGTGKFHDLAVQPDGKIVAVGDLSIARFDATGALDPTFGSGGIVTPDLDGTVRAVELQTDGKIVLGMEFGDDDVGVARLSANGTLDATFDTDGIVSVPRGGGTEVADVLIQPDGNIVLLWTWHHQTFFDDQVIELARWLPDGSLDTTFDSDGMTDIDLDPFVAGHGLALQPDGKLVIAGETWEPFDRNAIVLRLTSTGALDASFGDGGVVQVVYGADFEQFDDVVLQPDGTILVAGSTGAIGVHDLITAKLLSDGSLDVSFDLDGQAVHDLGGDEQVTAMALQTDGKLLIAGQTDEDWAVLRLISTVTYPVACDGSNAMVITAYGETPTAGPDVIAGTDDPDVIDGLEGDDVMCGFGGDDVLAGGLGLDLIYGGDGFDDIDGGKHNDRLHGGADDDVMLGAGGGDQMWGGAGNDLVRGGTGNDRIYGGSGVDELRGQNGSDLVYANDAVDFSTTDADTLFGGGLYDKLFGDAGNDIVYAGDFADVLAGKAGDDSLYGNNGVDVLRGGPHVTGDYCNGGAINSGSGDTATTCEFIENVP